MFSFSFVVFKTPDFADENMTRAVLRVASSCVRKSDASFKLIGLLASFLQKDPQKAVPSRAADFATHCREAESLKSSNMRSVSY